MKELGGSLLPARYLASAVQDGTITLPDLATTEVARRRLRRWWRSVETACGPATGLHGLFNLVAMPLAAMLGFRASAVQFERGKAEARLTSAAGDAVVGLVVLPWALAPSERWRDVFSVGRRFETNWCLLLAPPFISVVETRASAVRRSADFELPRLLEEDPFRFFWLLAHASAFDGPSARVDSLVSGADHFQDRVRRDLQHGVARALGALGSSIGATAHQRGVAPSTRQDPSTRSGQEAAFDEALTVIYRILFLLFAESRHLVPRDQPIYSAAYAVTTLCRTAATSTTAPSGLWESLAAVTRLSRSGCRTDDLMVRPFNGHLFARSAAPTLEIPVRSRRGTRASTIRDQAVREALVSLGTRAGRGGREEISYADLDVEQLGAVYERVLDLDPASALQNAKGGALRLDHAERPRSGQALRLGEKAEPRSGQAGRQRAQGRRRKRTGTFYTPRSLTEFVVRRTLGPLVRGASADAILALRVVDPAMGSGAFLVAACRYLAAAYEQALIEEGRRVEADFDADARADIRRLIAEHCLAGVDVNPVAVQLARLSLWLTSLARGKPLGFLDHRLRTGNSLIGTTPDDLWRRRGRRRSDGTLPLFEAAQLEASLRDVAPPLKELMTRRDDDIEAVHRKSAIWRRLTGSQSPLESWRIACALWCARWFWPLDSARDKPARNGAGGRGTAPSDAELSATIDAVLKSDTTMRPGDLERWISIAREQSAHLGMFHWPLEFADVFYDDTGQPRTRPGFDAVIGNPPWEMLRDDGGGSRTPAQSVSRTQMVRFVRESGLYPSCDRGHVNLYQPFLERALSLVRAGGRVGFVLPWGLAADDGARALRRRLFDTDSVDTLVGLDNSAGFFPIHRGLRFMVLVASPGGPRREARARFGVRTAEELTALPDSEEAGDVSAAFPVRLSNQLLTAIGGPGRRIPDIRRIADLQLLERLTAAYPAAGAADGWCLRFGRELNATEDRKHFGRVGLPVIEGKHLGPFTVNAGACTARVPARVARDLLPDERFSLPRLGYRDVSGVTNRLSLIAAVLPAGVVTTHTVFCLRTPLSEHQQHFLCGVLNSYVVNALGRLLMGGHVTTSLVEQLPLPIWRDSAIQRRIARLAERLSRRGVTAGALASLQAAVARLYGLDEATFASVLEGFPLIDRQSKAAALAALSCNQATIRLSSVRACRLSYC